MEVVIVYWWSHNCPSGQYSSAKVHNSLEVKEKEKLDHIPDKFEDYDVIVHELEGLEPEVFDGI